MRYLLSGIILAFCAGCQHLPQVALAVPKDVGIAVPGKCIKKKDIPPTPEFPLDVVELDGKEDLARLTNAARLERKTRGEYVTAVGKVLEKCSE